MIEVNLIKSELYGYPTRSSTAHEFKGQDTTGLAINISKLKSVICSVKENKIEGVDRIQGNLISLGL